MGHSLWGAGAPEPGAWDVVGHFGNSLAGFIKLKIRFSMARQALLWVFPQEK